MSVSLLAGCGGSKEEGGSASSGGKTELTFGIWDENQRPAMEAMVEAYEKEHEDVTIEIQLTPYKGGEYWTKLEAAATGGKAPDVFWLNVLHLDSYVEGGIPFWKWIFSPLLLIGLGLADVNYGTWVKWSWKFQTLNLVLTSLLLLFGMGIGY